MTDSRLSHSQSRVFTFLRFATGLFAVLNIACGVPIAVGLMSARTFVPLIMEHFDGCDGPGPERLYNVMFGLLAVWLGVVRAVAVVYWHVDAVRFLVACSYGIEFVRDATVMVEGYIGASEAVALFPSLLLALAMILAELSSAAFKEPKQD